MNKLMSTFAVSNGYSNKKWDFLAELPPLQQRQLAMTSFYHD